MFLLLIIFDLICYLLAMSFQIILCICLVKKINAILAVGILLLNFPFFSMPRSKFAFVRLDGTLNQQQREKVLKQFSEDSSILVCHTSI